MREITLTVRGDTVHASRHRAGIRGEANATALVINFDESWDGYSKKITFWDALEQNPVERILTVDLLVDAAKDMRTYKTTIPGEPLALAGECVLIIDGYVEGTRARSMSVRLTVEEAPVADNAGEPTDPMPEPYEQLQLQIEVLTDRTQTVAQGVEEVREIAEHFDAVVEEATETIDKAVDNANTAAVSAGKSAQNAAASERAAAEHKTGAEAAATLAEGYTSHPPIIGENGNWWEWDGEAYTDTGKPSRGETGPQGIQGNQGIQGKQGIQGERGPSGVYVGSGDMPKDCSVQIDEDGDVVTMESLVEAVLAEMGPAIGEIETALSRIADLQESYMSTAELDRIIALEEQCIGGDG